MSSTPPNLQPVTLPEAVARDREAIAGYLPMTRMRTGWSRFVIKTVDDAAELELALSLRHEVFYRELLGRGLGHGLDVDDFDLACDHLVIVDERSHEMIGTYRLNPGLRQSRYYSQTEFHLDDFLAQPGRKLEMGRACIRQDRRNGFTMIALWKGLAHYVQEFNAGHPEDPIRFMFGCSSLKGTEPRNVAALWNWLCRRGAWDDSLGVRPLDSFVLPGLGQARAELGEPTAADTSALERQIPPLLWAYLDAGARVLGEPALDRDFECVDFLTLLDVANLRPDLVRKYKPW